MLQTAEDSQRSFCREGPEVYQKDAGPHSSTGRPHKHVGPVPKREDLEYKSFTKAILWEWQKIKTKENKTKSLPSRILKIRIQASKCLLKPSLEPFLFHGLLWQLGDTYGLLFGIF